MSEKKVTEKQIQDKLDELISGHQDKTIRFFAKLIFNLRFDLNELKLELIKVLSGEEDVVLDREIGECQNEEFFS